MSKGDCEILDSTNISNVGVLNTCDNPGLDTAIMSAVEAPVQEETESLNSEGNADPDWIGFLFLLGNHLEQLRQDGCRPCVILVVPTVEFASLLITAGIIYQNLTRMPDAGLSESARRFDEMIGQAVRFPRMVSGKKRQLRGVLERIEVTNGVERLVIKYFEKPGSNRQSFEAYIKSDDFPLVDGDEEGVKLSARQRGQQLAANICSLQQLVGHHGASSLLSQKKSSCWIIDTKCRIIKELEVPVPMNRLTKPQEGNMDMTLLLKDIVRPNFSHWPAVEQSSRSHIDTEPPSSGDWMSAICVGTLPFLRFFEAIESEIRIGIISPTMSMYDETLSQAQKFFEQRAEHEIVIPDDLLFAKPASFDIQIWETP